MSDIGKVLKDEIVRIAQREAAQTIKELNKAAVALQQELAALRQEASSLTVSDPAATDAQIPVKGQAVAKVQRSSKVKKPRAIKTVQSKSAGEATASVEAAGPAVTFTAASVKDLRKQLGLTQEAFAKLCGVSVNTVGNWEASKKKQLNLRPDKLAALAKVQAKGSTDA